MIKGITVLIYSVEFVPSQCRSQDVYLKTIESRINFLIKWQDLSVNCTFYHAWSCQLVSFFSWISKAIYSMHIFHTLDAYYSMLRLQYDLYQTCKTQSHLLCYKSSVINSFVHLGCCLCILLANDCVHHNVMCNISSTKNLHTLKQLEFLHVPDNICSYL